MGYDSTLRGPKQALTEFGRAVAAGIGFDVDPVTTIVPTGKNRMKRKYGGSLRGRNVRFRGGPTMAPSVRTPFRRTPYYRNLGLRPGRYPSKKHLKEFSSSNTVDKSLYRHRLIQVPYNATEQMNTRQGRLVNVRGVKLRLWMSLKNQSENTNKLDVPIMVRWAVLNPKENTGDPDDVAVDNFFISADPSGEEATDFPSTGNCFAYMNRQINRRRFGVLQQGKFILANDPASNNSRVSLGSRKLINLWLPIKRQMKWSSNTEDDPTTNISIVYWYCQVGDKDSAKKFTDGPIDLHAESITYFKDSPGFN